MAILLLAFIPRAAYSREVVVSPTRAGSYGVLARMIHDGSSPFDKAQGPEHSRGTTSPESAFLVNRISFKCFEFHVSGFKVFESDW